MIRLLEGFPDSVLGVEAVGKVTDEDYANVLVPAVRAKREARGAREDTARRRLRRGRARLRPRLGLDLTPDGRRAA